MIRCRSIILVLSFALMLVLPMVTVHIHVERESVFAQDDGADETPTAPMDTLEGKVVYFTEDNGEASRFDRGARGLSRFAGLVQTYGVDLKTLTWETGIPDDTDLLVVGSPTQDFSPLQIFILWTYLSEGGNALLITDGFDYNNDQQIERANDALETDQGFFEIAFGQWGVQPVQDLVIANPQTDSELPPLPTQYGLLFPPFITDGVLTPVDVEHQIIQDLDGSIFFSGARSIDIDSTTVLDIVPLLLTDSIYYGESDIDAYLREGVLQINIGQDTPQGPQVLMVALENVNTGGRVVILSDVDVINNSGGFRTSPRYTTGFVFPQNVQLGLNTIAWVAGAGNPSFEPSPPEATATPTNIPSPMPTMTATLSLDQVATLQVVATEGCQCIIEGVELTATPTATPSTTPTGTPTP